MGKSTQYIGMDAYPPLIVRASYNMSEYPLFLMSLP